MPMRVKLQSIEPQWLGKDKVTWEDRITQERIDSSICLEIEDVVMDG